MARLGNVDNPTRLTLSPQEATELAAVLLSAAHNDKRPTRKYP